MSVLLVLIILVTTLIGSICGMGGGVIIKPLLDAISSYSSFQISLISCSCVLAMTIVSLIKHYIGKTKVNIKIAIYLSFGSIIGGLIGDLLFGIVNDIAQNSFQAKSQSILKIVQNSVLLVLIVLVSIIYVKKNKKVYSVTNPLVTIAIGTILGALSVFLDIGGGPINVCTFVIIFGMDMKLASVSSLITIFFAQITKFAKLIISGSLTTNIVFDTNLSVVIFWLFIVLAVVGGFCGTILNKKISVTRINQVYFGALIFVLLLTIFNIIKNIIILG